MSANATQESVNQYREFSEYYNHLMLGGYYDYDAQVSSLMTVLKPGSSVLEIGIGTGIIAERLIAQSLYLTGVDHSPEMLVQARERLGPVVELIEADVRHLKLGRQYDIALSNGGAWYGIWVDEEVGYCGHLPTQEMVENSIEHVAAHVKSGGKLILSMQDDHRDSTMELPNGLYYEQKIIYMDENTIEKCYIFKKKGEVVSEQHLTLGYIKPEIFEATLSRYGLRNRSLTEDRRYIYFTKE